MALDVGTVFARLRLDTSAAEKSISGFNARLAGLGAALTAAGGAGLYFGKMLADGAAKSDLFRRQLIVLTGSVQAGTQAFQEMIQLESQVPFRLDELMNAARMVEAFHINLGGLTNTMRIFGDVASAMQVPLSQVIENFARFQAGMFSERFAVQVGISRQELAKFGVEFGRMGRVINAAKLPQAVLRSWERFGGMMEQYMQTYPGQLTSFESSLQKLKAALGTALLPSAIRLVEGFTNVVNATREWAQANPQLAGTLVKLTVALSAVMALIGPLLMGFAGLKWSLATLGVAGPLGKAIAGIGGLRGALALLPRLLVTVLGGLAAFAANAATYFRVVLAGGATLGEGLAATFGGLGAIFLSPVAIITAALAAILAGLRYYTGSWRKTVEVFGDGLIGIFKGIWNTAVLIVGGAAGAIEHIVATLVDVVKLRFRDIGKTWGDYGRWIAGQAGNVYRAFGDALDPTKDKYVEKGEAILGKLQGKLKSLTNFRVPAKGWGAPLPGGGRGGRGAGGAGGKSPAQQAQEELDLQRAKLDLLAQQADTQERQWQVEQKVIDLLRQYARDPRLKGTADVYRLQTEALQKQKQLQQERAQAQLATLDHAVKIAATEKEELPALREKQGLLVSQRDALERGTQAWYDADDKVREVDASIRQIGEDILDRRRQEADWALKVAQHTATTYAEERAALMARMAAASATWQAEPDPAKKQADLERIWELEGQLTSLDKDRADLERQIADASAQGYQAKRDQLAADLADQQAEALKLGDSREGLQAQLQVLRLKGQLAELEQREAERVDRERSQAARADMEAARERLKADEADRLTTLERLQLDRAYLATLEQLRQSYADNAAAVALLDREIASVQATIRRESVTWTSMFRSAAQEWQSQLASGFFDIMQGKMHSLSDAFSSLLADIEHQIAQWLASQVVQQFLSIFGGLGLGSLLGAAAPAGAGSWTDVISPNMAAVRASALPSLAAGGAGGALSSAAALAPSQSAAEMRSLARESGGASGPVSVHIHAVDAASFAALCHRDGGRTIASALAAAGLGNHPALRGR